MTAGKFDAKKYQQMAAAMTQNKPLRTAVSNPLLQANSAGFNPDTSADGARWAAGNARDGVPGDNGGYGYEPSNSGPTLPPGSR